MKQLFTVLIAAGMMFVACDKNDDKNETPETLTNQTYVGTLTVDQTDGTTYTQENVTVGFAITDTAGMVLTLNQVSFSERMPVKIDMTIPHIEYTANGANYNLSGNNIVPLAMGGEFPKYTITNLSGTIVDGALSVSMNCGGFPIKFSGSASKE